MSLSRKRKKELRRLQDQASRLWDSQQVLVGEAAAVAREAGRQLGNYNREHVSPTIQANYEKYAAPYVQRGVKTAKQVFDERFVPAAGAVVGSALSVWDAAAETRAKAAASAARGAAASAVLADRAKVAGKKASKAFSKQVVAAAPPEPERSFGPAKVIAVVLGVAAAAGILFASWQTLRADDELWVADDPPTKPAA